MVSKSILVAAVAIPLILIGVYFFTIPLGSTQVPQDTSSLVDILIVIRVPLEMSDDGSVIVREMSQPFFSVDAKIIKMYGEEVQTFEYRTIDDAQNDIDEVTSDGQFRNVNVIWVGTPHFYRSDRLIILYVGDHVDIIDTLEDLFGPQFAG